MLQRLLFPALLVVAVAIGLLWSTSRQPVEDASGPTLTSGPTLGRTLSRRYDDVVARFDTLIVAEVKLFEAQGRRNQAHCERLADLWQGRVRLTGSYDDYASAEEWIGRAFSLAPKNLGPHVARARLHFALHRLDRCTADVTVARGWLAMAPTQLGQLAELETDLAFQQGRYDEAELEMRKSYSHGKGVRPGARLALAIAPLGASAEAREILAEIEAKLSGGDPVFRAWVQLQRGLLELESGRPEKALPHYRRADETLAGWWLVEEHIAEALAQTGELEEARKIYERVVADTGHPELMYALAGVLADLGDQEQAARWTREARQQFEVRLAMFPEAAAGHALEFFLEEDGDGARSLELAETNFRLRPNGAANNFLARAYLKVGRVEDAVNTAEAARASGWKTARLLATLTRALAAADRSEDAEAAKQEALAVNPRVFD